MLELAFFASFTQIILPNFKQTTSKPVDRVATSQLIGLLEIGIVAPGFPQPQLNDKIIV